MAKIMTTREKILNLCLNLFAKKGFDGVSLRDIASGVGIKESSVYNHFKSKQDILDCLIKDNIQICENNISQIFEGINLANNQDIYLSDKGFQMIGEKLFEKFFMDKNVTKFWSILTIEQFKNKNVAEMQSKLFFDDILGYIMNMFYEMTEKNILINVSPAVLALEFYSPIYMVYQRYIASGFENLTEIQPFAKSMISEHISNFCKNYRATNK
ncbi:MAG: TetR/AcrR family transcriptional regulator [Oscillospiraceae bacterium]